MAQITQAGALNTTALTVPDLYVQIAQPQTLGLNGVPSGLVGVVGTASWGKVGQATVLGTMGDYGRAFGPVVARKYDLGTPINVAIGAGATGFVAVRATDGTDLASAFGLATGGANGQALGLASVCTGSVGNATTFTLAAGSASGTTKATLSNPILGITEVFDRIAYVAPATGNPAPNGIWIAIAAAITNGQGATRGPSRLVTCGPGASSAAATGSYGTYTLSGGTDGALGVTGATLVGQDGLSRTGMYALRNTAASLGILADCDDSTTWTTQAAFGQAEGIYMILTGPSGDTIANAVTAKQAAGLDNYGAKLMFGDWLYWADPTAQITRLVSSQGHAAGKLASLSPEQSGLNKQINTVLGSQKSGLAASGGAVAYSSAELATLIAAGIDVICNPAPGGAYWALRSGHNSSSNPGISGDSYTRLTNFIAETLAAGMGGYVGSVINATLLTAIEATLLNFLSVLDKQGILGSVDGSLPYAVVCDASNNPQTRTALGYVQADVQVQYQGINEKFLVNLQGGQTVTITQAGG